MPEPAERGGFNLSLGLAILTALSEIEGGRGEGFVTISEVVKHVSNALPGVTREDVAFAIEMLAASREIRFTTVGPGGALDTAYTRNTTQLVEVATGFAQVRLNENGRLLLRVRALKDRWLYHDLDAAKLAKAIEYGRFDDVPELCEQMRVELAGKSRTLTQMMERPALVELRESLIHDGARIADTLRKAKQVLMTASDLLYTDQIHSDFEVWQRRSRVTYYVENLRAELDLVVQTVESFSRRFMQFLQSAQRVRHAGAERIRFLDIADHLVVHGGPESKAYLEAAFENILPFGVYGKLFHPEFLTGAVDFGALLGTDNPDAAPTEIERDLSEDGSHERMQNFVLRHREYIMSRLRQGPMRFSDLLQRHGLTLREGESAIDFFGVYAAADNLNAKDEEIILGFALTETEFEVEGKRYLANDPVLVLRKKEA